MTSTRKHSAIWLLLLALFAVGCGADGPPASANRIEVDLDKSDPERLLRYYFGGYAASGGADPFEAGLLDEAEGRYFVDLATLDARQPGLGATLREAAGDTRATWDELAAFLEATYYDARALPPTLDALRAEVPYHDGSEPWLHVEIDGVMTTARRHVYVPEAALRHALERYEEHSEAVIYPVGTTLVGEHHEAGTHTETTVMRKRNDGFWDFFTYGPDGTLSRQTQPRPRALKTPTQCVGCHYGRKLFEPERSFPGAAPDGPHGPRALYVDDALRNADVTAFFDEHRKRSDNVLGLYATLFVAQLHAERQAGTLAPEDARLLDALGR